MNYNSCKHNLVKCGGVWILYNNTNIQNSEIRIANISRKPVLLVTVNHKFKRNSQKKSKSLNQNKY
jgi:hypothetical protein